MSFYDLIEPVTSLDAALDPARYRPAPDDWRLLLTDIEHSTEAIARGMHKTVNMTAAACIAAVRNSAIGQELPYSFGGDGATLLVPPDKTGTALAALAGVQASAKDFGLHLRVGLISVADLRARGHDLLVARYEAAPGITFAMFRGGGVNFLERVLKGHVPSIPASTVIVPTLSAEPDLTGLSCRFEPIASRGGCTVSVVIAMLEANEDYRPVLGKLLEIAGDNAAPASLASLSAALSRTWLPSRENVAMELAAFAATDWRGRLRRRAWLTVGWLTLQLGIRLGLRWATRALEEKIRNSDFCKADDALQMVIDCTPADLARIEAYLAELEARGVLVYGLHVADSVLMTCLVDSTTSHWHVHFIDGAGGGYTSAAKIMKGKLAQRRAA
jgi:hypothetical protein